MVMTMREQPAFPTALKRCDSSSLSSSTYSNTSDSSCEPSLRSSSSFSDEETGPIFWTREYEEPHGFLSQWYQAAFEVDGVTYCSAEQWMMLQKALLFGDEATAQKVRETTDPAEHQALGRKTKGFTRAIWDQHKSRIVEEGNYHKFSKNIDKPELLQLFLETGNRELVEAYNKCRIWSIGFSQEEAEANRELWGLNLLGKALMTVRERLRDEAWQTA